MANWIGVITNAGNNLLAEWVNGKLLTFEHAAAGSGTVPAEALQTQTALTAQKQTVHIMGSERVSNGIRLKLRITAPQTGYTLNQFGIWAKLGEVTTMIALFQHSQGIPIPSANEAPDFVYTFFATVMASNMGNWTIRVDPSAMQDLEKCVTLVLHSPPTQSTGGEIGRFAIDQGTGLIYKCVRKTHDGRYIWEPIFDGGNITKTLKIKGERIFFEDSDGNPVFFIMAYGGKMFIGGSSPRSRVVISGVDTPQYEDEAANKGYVDGEVNKKLSTSGHAPNKVLVTDISGNVVVKDAPSGGYGTSVPTYIVNSAKKVAHTVSMRQTSNSFSFAVIADAHLGYYEDRENNAGIQAGLALKTINDRIPLDLVAHAGDTTTGAWDTTKESTYTDNENYSELIYKMCNAPSVIMPGNHDDAPYQETKQRLSQAEMYTLFGRKNLQKGCVVPEGCNYGYLDFDSRKLRVIILDTDDKRMWNTVHSGQSAPPYLNAHNITGAQLQWIANTALDFSGKTDAAKWGVIVLSHVCLDIAGQFTDPIDGKRYAHSTANAAKIFSAYALGKSGSITHNGVSVPFNFASGAGDRAKILCFVHGHNHAYLDKKVEGILSIGCPNVMAGRERSSSDGKTYSKAPGTENGTSFCIITVDRENNKIYADHYGAGYDRQWEYKAPEKYTNQLPISTDTDGSIYGIGENLYLSSSDGAPHSMSGHYVSGFIPCVVGDKINFKHITAKTGDNYTRFSFYDSSKTHLVQISLKSTAPLNQAFGSDGNLSQITVEHRNAAYMRFCCPHLGPESIVTVNEDIY